MAGDRKGVGVRLFVEGGEIVKRAFDGVADSGKKMWAQIALGEKSANPAVVALSRTSLEAQNAVGGLASRVGGAAGVLSSFGAVGVGVAATLGGLTLAFREAVAVAEYGDQLEAVAKKAGVTIVELQRLRFAAEETDVGAGAMDAGLQKLNATLGAFKTGVGDAKVKEAFEALKFEPEDLRGLKDAAAFLPVLADRISQVNDKADRVKLAKMLGVEELLPLLEEGGDALRRYGDEAEAAGHVIDEGLIRRLAVLDREMERADGRVKVASTTFFSQFTPAVAESKNAVADLLTALALMIDLTDKHADSAIQATPKINMWADAMARVVRLTSLIAFPGFPRVFGGPREFDPDRVDWDAVNAQGRQPDGFVPKGFDPRGSDGGGGRRGRAGSEKLAYKGTLPPDLLAAIAEGRLTETEARRMFTGTGEVVIINQVTPIKAGERETIEPGGPVYDLNPQGFESSAERMKTVRAAISEALEWDQEQLETWARNVGDATAQGLDAALHGDFWEYFKQQLYQAALQGLSNAVTDALSGQTGGMLFSKLGGLLGWESSSGFSDPNGGGGSGGGWGDFALSTFASMFGGNRAAGGGMDSGLWYRAGEHGQTELMMAGANGYVADAAATQRMLHDAVSGAGAGGANGVRGGALHVNMPAVVVNVPPGFVGHDQLVGMIQGAVGQSIATAVDASGMAAPGQQNAWRRDKG